MLTRTLLTLALLLGLVTGCAKDQAIISQATQAHGQIDPAILPDPELQAYLDKIATRIVSTAEALSEVRDAPKAHYSEDAAWMFKNVKFHFVNGGDTLNAFTTGGEHVYLYTALFEQSETEDEFAAVVAHEFAHIYGRHVHNGMNRQYWTIGAAVAGGGAGYLLGGENRETYAAAAAAVAASGAQLYGAGFGRKDEGQADEYGFKFYTRAGYDPAKFDDFFQQMIDKGFDKDAGPAASHPRLGDRVTATEARVRDLPPTAADWRKPNVVSQREFDRLRERSRAAGRAMPRDKSLDQAKLMLAAFPSCVSPAESQQSQQAARELLVEAHEEQGTR